MKTSRPSLPNSHITNGKIKRPAQDLRAGTQHGAPPLLTKDTLPTLQALQGL
jgi:hypothetical protein